MVDYTGKLNDHKDYLRILKRLEAKTAFIEIVVIDGRETNPILQKFAADIVSRKRVSSWWGTKTCSANLLYRIKATKRLFQYLAGFESFCKYFYYGTSPESIQRQSDYAETTDFGLDDIAFYGENGSCLLCTTTHEGYIMADSSIAAP